MKRKTNQPDLPLCGLANIFNLAGQRGEDPGRLMREREAAERREREAAEYEARYQRKLSECPGFVGGDAPRGPGAEGRVVVDPRLVLEARSWLTHRFAVNDALSLSEIADGIVFEIRARATPGQRTARRRGTKFGRPEQFELDLPAE